MKQKRCEARVLAASQQTLLQELIAALVQETADDVARVLHDVTPQLRVSSVDEINVVVGHVARITVEEEDAVLAAQNLVLDQLHGDIRGNQRAFLRVSTLPEAYVHVLLDQIGVLAGRLDGLRA